MEGTGLTWGYWLPNGFKERPNWPGYLGKEMGGNYLGRAFKVKGIRFFPSKNPGLRKVPGRLGGKLG